MCPQLILFFKKAPTVTYVYNSMYFDFFTWASSVVVEFCGTNWGPNANSFTVTLHGDSVPDGVQCENAQVFMAHQCFQCELFYRNGWQDHEFNQMKVQAAGLAYPLSYSFRSGGMC